MDDPNDRGLRKLVGRHDKFVYEAVKAGKVAELPHESQLLARAIQEHMHLKHVHNALEFADLREGEPYEIMVNGDPVSPLAHVATHSAVKGQIEEDPIVRAAFDKMVATGASAHHAEHVLAAMLMELLWQAGQGTGAEGMEKAKLIYQRKIKKLSQDSVYRWKLTRKFPDGHSVFE
jgi:hypothetical protein